MSLGKKVIGFLRLYRLSVFVRFFLFYLLGCYAAAGLAFDLPYNLLIALLIAAVSVNFIYSLNSWFDADIDKINKPNRPIPSGVVTKSEALYYSLGLLALSLVYPVLLFGFSYASLILFWLPLAGILYSNPIFSFKKHKYLALFLITASIFLIALLGYLLNGGTFDSQFFFYCLVIVVSCLAVVPLKDLSDVEGDTAYGAQNWFARGPASRKIIRSIALLGVSAAIGFFIEEPLIQSILALNAACITLAFVLWRFYGKPLHDFYLPVKLIIISTMVGCFGVSFIYAAFIA